MSVTVILYKFPASYAKKNLDKLEIRRCPSDIDP